MAHHKSALKRIRQDEVKTARNKARISRIRTFIKRVDVAIEAKDHKKAMEALKGAQAEIMRGVSKGVIKLNTASRKISRLNAQIKALKA